MKHFPVDELRTLHRGDALERYIATLARAGRLDNVASSTTSSSRTARSCRSASTATRPRSSERGDRPRPAARRAARTCRSLPLGDSDTVRVGESIWAVGYPAVASSTDDVIGGWLSRDSDLEATFNPGIITAIKRNVDEHAGVSVERGHLPRQLRRPGRQPRRRRDRHLDVGPRRRGADQVPRADQRRARRPRARRRCR